MAMPLSWKIGAGVVAAIVLAGAWRFSAEHYSQYQADQINKDAAHLAEQEAQQAKERARLYHAELEQNLQQRREALDNNYQQINDQARKYQKAESVRLEKERQEKLRLTASYILGPNQQCLGGIVINQKGASFSQATGTAGHKISCEGQKAAEPLR
jgi:hypothetical protein